MKKNFLTLGVYAVILFWLLVTPSWSGTAQYTYDNLNRLVQVQYEDGTVIQYTYDTAGNRLVKEVTPLPPPPPSP
ncbi:MAG: RHS repeat domain-containing protein [Desulfobaccales bacterium]